MQTILKILSSIPLIFNVHKNIILIISSLSVLVSVSYLAYDFVDSKNKTISEQSTLIKSLGTELNNAKVLLQKKESDLKNLTFKEEQSENNEDLKNRLRIIDKGKTNEVNTSIGIHNGSF